MTVLLRHLDVHELTSAAGGDPWQLNKTLPSGSPGEISELASAFHAAGVCTRETDDEFNAAKQRFESAWDRQDGGDHPINDSDEVKRATESLRLSMDQMSRVGVDLQNISASLAEAQRSGTIAVESLETRLEFIDAEVDREIAAGAANGQDVDWSALKQAAVDAVRHALRQVDSIRQAYAKQLDASRLNMAGQGYSDTPVATVDGDGALAGNAEARAVAADYDAAQRAADQAVVNSSGPWSPEKAAAAGRLRDSSTINDPTAGVDGARYAAERLNDYRMSKYLGPLPTDTVLGGDARTRARARLQMQALMTSPDGFSGKRPMTPDQATRLLNQWEANGRTMMLDQFSAQMQQAGVSAEGARQAVDEIQNGQSPRQVVNDALAGIASQAGNLGEGAKAHADAMPGGGHWGNAPVWSHTDAEALRGFGSKIGAAGTVIDGVLTFNDVVHGAPPGEEAAKFGGRTLGAMGGGFVAGAAWGSFVGPEGTLVVGFLGALAGGIGGEKVVNLMMGK